MAFKQIKNKVSQYTGLDDSDAADLSLMKALINSAAFEIYTQGDLPGALDEAVFTMDQNLQIAIPNFAANIRGMREYYSQVRRSLTQISDRYQNNPWTEDWQRFRVKANSPVMHDIVNTGILTLTAQTAESSLIQIVGQTVGSARVSETVNMTGSIMTTTNQFIKIHSITANAARIYDITFTDINGIVIAILYNNELLTNYQILLLSNYPWSNTTANQTMEILYKRAFLPFINDGDEFVSPGYDDAIFYQFQSNWDGLRKGDEDRALLADRKCIKVLQNAVDDKSAKMPDAHIIFRPSAGQRVQELISYDADRFVRSTR